MVKWSEKGKKVFVNLHICRVAKYDIWLKYVSFKKPTVLKKVYFYIWLNETLQLSSL